MPTSHTPSGPTDSQLARSLNEAAVVPEQGHKVLQTMKILKGSRRSGTSLLHQNRLPHAAVPVYNMIIGKGRIGPDQRPRWSVSAVCITILVPDVARRVQALETAVAAWAASRLRWMLLHVQPWFQRQLNELCRRFGTKTRGVLAAGRELSLVLIFRIHCTQFRR